LRDPVFSFYAYRQSVAPVGVGAFAGIDALTVTIAAHRHASVAALFLVLPLCLITGVGLLTLFLDPASDARLRLPASAAAATMAFSFVVGAASPPVGYVTRAHLLVLQAYAFAAISMLQTCYVRAIALAVAELDAAQAARRRLIKDAFWIAGLSSSAGAATAGEVPAAPAKAPAAPTPPPPVLDALPPSVFLDMAALGVDATEPDERDMALAHLRAVERAVAGNSAAARRGHGPLRYEELTADGPTAAGGGAAAGGSAGLLASPAVQRFCKEGWGAAPVPLFGGIGIVTAASAASWREHAARSDEWARAVLLPLAAGTVAVLVGVESLSFISSPFSSPHHR
jgi:hypothetical protein